MIRLIICPQCLRWSADPFDAADAYCGACRLRTQGPVIEITDDETPGRFVEAAARAQSLYAVEVYACRATLCGVDLDALNDALMRGVAAGQEPGAPDATE